MKYSVKRIVIVTASRIAYTSVENEKKLEHVQELADSIADGYEIYHASVFSSNDFCGTEYILRKPLEKI